MSSQEGDAAIVALISFARSSSCSKPAAASTLAAPTCFVHGSAYSNTSAFGRASAGDCGIASDTLFGRIIGGALDRGRYAALYGPTAGDRIRLADTNLLIEVEEDRSAGPQPGAARLAE